MADHEAAVGGQYTHVLNAFNSTPWAVLPETLDVIAEVIGARLRGEHWSAEEIQARIGRRSDADERRVTMHGSIAVLPLEGVIFPRANVMTDLSGATSAQQFAAELRQLVDDDDVEGILVDVNSPGGATDMIQETAAVIRELRGRKPIHAIANTMAASAAYWLAAQTDRVVATPSAKVGSIGVFGAHIDRSQQEHDLGLKRTLISAGKYKVEGNPFQPLTDEARAAMQERVDETYAVMVGDIAKGRGVAVEAVRDGYGEGRTLSARKALTEGMVDGVATIDQAIAGVQREIRSRRRAAGQPAATTTATASVSGTSVDVSMVGDAASMAAWSANGGALDIGGAYAGSGIVETFSEEAAAALRAVDQLLTRCESLADYARKGRLTSAKRDILAELADALRIGASKVDRIVADTGPDRHREAAAREHARMLHHHTIRKG